MLKNVEGSIGLFKPFTTRPSYGMMIQHSFNPLSPNSAQNQFSPNDIHRLS